MPVIQVKRTMKNGVIKVYEYDVKNYYKLEKEAVGYYKCPKCDSLICNKPQVISKHNQSNKCKNIEQTKKKITNIPKDDANTQTPEIIV